MLLIFAILLVGTGVAVWRQLVDSTCAARTPPVRNQLLSPAGIAAQHIGSPRSDRLLQTRVREMEAAFQEAKNGLAICQDATKPGLDAELTTALQKWGSAAANYNDALARYDNFLIDFPKFG